MGRAVSSAEVARLAGVSRATVSYVVNGTSGRRIGEATRERVLAAAADLGYIPDSAARALRSGRSSIALLYFGYAISDDDAPAIELSPVGDMLQQALARKLRKVGKALLVWADATRPVEESLHNLTPCLLIAPVGLPASSVAGFEAAGVPVVTLSPAVSDRTGQPRSDAWLAGWTQAEHLVDRGHRRIGYVVPNLRGFESMAAERSGGALAYATDHNAEVLVFELSSPDRDPMRALGEQLTAWATDGVSAVACFNDILAAVVLRSARELGLEVPSRLAVIGCDDEIIAALGNPPLSTVRFNVEAMADDLIAQCLAALEGLPRPTTGSNRVELVARSTT